MNAWPEAQTSRRFLNVFIRFNPTCQDGSGDFIPYRIPCGDGDRNPVADLWVTAVTPDD